MIPSKAYALIPYRRQAADYIHGSAVICEVVILHPNTKVLDFGVFSCFLGVKNTPLSPLHLFPDLMDLNLRIYREHIEILEILCYNVVQERR